MDQERRYAQLGHTHDDIYYTELEIDAFLELKSPVGHNHDLLYAALSHTHDDRYYTETETDTLLTGKQPTLVSGTNIKTVNSTSLLGSGNVAVQPTLVSGTNIKTVNSNTLLGSGDIAVQPTLVSGTNIKTVNSTSLLGSGDVAVQATLVSGTNIKTVNGSSLLGSGDLTVSGTDPTVYDDSATYRQFLGKAGSASAYVRSTSNGLIASANGVGVLGTSTWAWDESYVNKYRSMNTADASLASTDHAFQIGASNTANLIMDQNEIIARNNGAAATLYVQGNGSGDFSILPDSTYASGYNAKIFLNPIVEKGNTGSVYWTKFYDGTIEFYANVATSAIACSTAMGAGGGFRTVTQSLTLPVALATTGYGWVSVGYSSSSMFNISGGGYINTTTTVYWYLCSVSSDATTRTRTACIRVIGRWY